MKDWADDLAACLAMMLDRGALFDLDRATRAGELLRRLHPRFRGDMRVKIREQLAVLCERGSAERIAGDVFRWRGEVAAPTRAAPAPASGSRPRAAVAAPPSYYDAAANVLGAGDPDGELPTARLGKAADVHVGASPSPELELPAAEVRPRPPGRTGRSERPGVSLPSGGDFEAELSRRFTDAAAAGREHVHVSAFELHRALAPYPAPVHRMRLCCTVMRGAMTGRDQALTHPPSGKDGPELLIKYALPR